MVSAIRAICFTILSSAFPFRAAAEDFTNAIRAFLQQRVEVEKRDGGIGLGVSPGYCRNEPLNNLPPYGGSPSASAVQSSPTS
jgi:hypothetical protein